MILDWILDFPNANPPPPKEIVQLGRFENGCVSFNILGCDNGIVARRRTACS